MNILKSIWDTLNFDSMTVTVIFLILVFALLFYFLPSLVASARHKRQFLAIFLINLFAGWTLIAWFGALIWAAIVEKSDYEDIKHRDLIFKPEKRPRKKDVVIQPEKIQTQETNNITSERQSIKNVLTKKRNIKDLLFQKLW
jgi:hypothetical protein